MADKIYQVEVNSPFEPWVKAKVCEPILALMPESVHPNTISIVTHFLCWVTAFLGFLSVHVEPRARAAALVGAGVCLLMSMIGDHLDGMQARRTNQCSRLGEVIDHWLDALAVPLSSVGLAMALQLPAWILAPALIGTAMVYNAQLVLYHHTGRFVHPDTSGSDGQVLVALVYFSMAFVFLYFGRNHYWVDKAVMGLAFFSVFLQGKILWFYYKRLKGLIGHHLLYVLLSAGLGALYVAGVMGAVPFCLLMVLLSFRITGTYVLFTLVDRRFNGFDLGVVGWTVAIALGHYYFEPIRLGSYTVQAWLPYLACIYMAARNGFDFVRHFPELRPVGEQQRLA